MNTLALGAIASLLAGLCTGLGALPVLLPTTPSEKVEGVLLGIGGGIMLAATSFSLIVPGTAAAVGLGYSSAIAALIMGVGVLLGCGGGSSAASPAALASGCRSANARMVATRSPP